MSENTKRLMGQKALVTGASSGIGRAIAIALGQAGADVVVNYSSSVRDAEAVADEVRQYSVRSFAHRADVALEDDVRKMFDSMLTQFGTIDILVANAGLQRDAPVGQMTARGMAASDRREPNRPVFMRSRGHQRVPPARHRDGGFTSGR